MIHYTQHTLSNGLVVLVQEDHNTPLCTVNLLYNVGARDENPSRTGFAHLFEHLMFGGTQKYPSYDHEVDQMGGESNAFTNNDITNYYLTVPSQYLEQAFMLEADRMRLLDFSQHSLSVQRQVVTEEYNQRYENQPYGDYWRIMLPLCYQEHPYRWDTIGADIKHVQEAEISDVEAFFFAHYRPDNCILSVVGNVSAAEVVALAEKHFGTILRPDGVRPPVPAMGYAKTYPQEHPHTEQRRIRVERNVPNSMLLIAFPMVGRAHDEYPLFDLLSDILSNGESSRLHNAFIKQNPLFVELSAFVSGFADNGLFCIRGKLSEGVDIHEAESALWSELKRMATEPILPIELEKVVNKYESTFMFEQYRAGDRAYMLCYYYWLGHLDWINSEPERYRKVSVDQLQALASQTFRVENSNVLEYLAYES